MISCAGTFARLSNIRKYILLLAFWITSKTWQFHWSVLVMVTPSNLTTIYAFEFLRVHSNCVKMMFNLLKVNDEFLAFIRIQLELVDCRPLLNSVNSDLHSTLTSSWNHLSECGVIHVFSYVRSRRVEIIDHQNEKPRAKFCALGHAWWNGAPFGEAIAR